MNKVKERWQRHDMGPRLSILKDNGSTWADARSIGYGRVVAIKNVAKEVIVVDGILSVIRVE